MIKEYEAVCLRRSGEDMEGMGGGGGRRDQIQYSYIKFQKKIF